MEVNIDAEELNQAIVTAVLDSALGAHVKNIIEDELDKFTSPHGSPLKKALEVEIQRLIMMTVRDDYGETIKAKMKEILTDQAVGDAVAAAWAALEDKLDQLHGARR